MQLRCTAIMALHRGKAGIAAAGFVSTKRGAPFVNSSARPHIQRDGLLWLCAAPATIICITVVVLLVGEFFLYESAVGHELA